MLLISHLLLFFFRSGTLFDSGAFCDMETNPSYEAIAVPPDFCALCATVLHYTYHVSGCMFVLKEGQNAGTLPDALP